MGTPVEVTGPVNLGNPVEFSIRELAETIIELTGSSSRIVHMPLPIDDPRQRRPDISKANELFDWAPTTPLRAGLEGPSPISNACWPGRRSPAAARSKSAQSTTSIEAPEYCDKTAQFG